MSLGQYVANILKTHPENDFLIDKYLDKAVEVDVDSVFDGEQLHIAGIMQHIEPAGVHSGDSTAVLPPYSLSDEVIKTIEEYQHKIAKEMGIVGFLNVQYAVKEEKVYVLEANPGQPERFHFLQRQRSGLKQKLA